MDNYLNKADLRFFIENGFIRIDQGFSREMAAAAVDMLWNDLPVDRNNPATWQSPVIRLGMYSRYPFPQSLGSERLHGIFDQLAGKDNWLPVKSVGSFPVRFPAAEQPNDTGRHVDVGFAGDDPADYFSWRSNIFSKGRALLILALYSDVSAADAPTVIYPGSHTDVARLLKDKGERGMSFTEIAQAIPSLPHRAPALATGDAGTVYLCHPFMVHAAQAHHGKNPKFMAQPPLLLKQPFAVFDEKDDASAVEEAIRAAIK